MFGQVEISAESLTAARASLRRAQVTSSLLQHLLPPRIVLLTGCWLLVVCAGWLRCAEDAAGRASTAGARLTTAADMTELFAVDT